MLFAGLLSHYPSFAMTNVQDWISRCWEWDCHGKLMPARDEERERIISDEERERILSDEELERIISDLLNPVTTTTPRNLVARHHTETVQSFFPNCKLFLE